MMPAQQRLTAENLVALKIDEGLIIELELTIGDRLAHISLQVAPGRSSASASRRRNGTSARSALGAVEREVSAL